MARRHADADAAVLAIRAQLANPVFRSPDLLVSTSDRSILSLDDGKGDVPVDADGVVPVSVIVFFLKSCQ